MEYVEICRVVELTETNGRGRAVSGLSAAYGDLQVYGVIAAGDPFEGGCWSFFL